MSTFHLCTREIRAIHFGISEIGVSQITVHQAGASHVRTNEPLLAALRHDRVEALSLLAGLINGEKFRLNVEKSSSNLEIGRHSHHGQSRRGRSGQRGRASLSSPPQRSRFS
jgi:hypothetical protein